MKKLKIYLDKHDAVVYWKKNEVVQKCVLRDQECTGSCPYLSMRKEGSLKAALVLHCCGNGLAFLTSNDYQDGYDVEIIKIDKKT